MKRAIFDEKNWRNHREFKRLCQAFLSCRDERQMAQLLRDIGTLPELSAWSERLQVASLLEQGLSYRAIEKKTGASTTTIARVAKFFREGEGGYHHVLKNCQSFRR